MKHNQPRSAQLKRSSGVAGRTAAPARAALIPLVLVGCLVHLVCLASSVPAATQVYVLQPAEVPSLRIDFNFNFERALPPFALEPELSEKEIARGRIPTVPSTPLLRNVSDSELYLNTDHTGDFVHGKVQTYRSVYDGHVIFNGLRVFTQRDGLEIPYTLDLYTYEHLCAGWLYVKSGWEGACEVDGQRWRMLLVDNLDGEIGQNDTLHLQEISGSLPGRLVSITPVPNCLFLNGHTFNLDFAFKPDESGVILEAAFTKTNLPFANLRIANHGCKYLCLSNEQVTAVANGTAGTVPVPAGVYRITGCVIDEIPGVFRQPSFVRCDRTVSLQPGQTTVLDVGLPLRNTIDVTRERNLLRLTYKLLGQAGEQYEYYDWRARPHFTVWNGPVPIGSGTLPFG